MTIKVKGGTRSQAAPRLCDTCKHASFRRGPAESEEQLECSAFDRREPAFKVVECPKYHPFNHPFIYEMEEIAWILRTDKLGKAIGFQHPNEDERSHRPAGFR